MCVCVCVCVCVGGRADEPGNRARSLLLPVCPVHTQPTVSSGFQAARGARDAVPRGQRHCTAATRLPLIKHSLSAEREREREVEAVSEVVMVCVCVCGGSEERGTAYKNSVQKVLWSVKCSRDAGKEECELKAHPYLRLAKRVSYYQRKPPTHCPLSLTVNAGDRGEASRHLLNSTRGAGISVRASKRVENPVIVGLCVKMTKSRKNKRLKRRG